MKKLRILLALGLSLTFAAPTYCLVGLFNFASKVACGTANGFVAGACAAKKPENSLKYAALGSGVALSYSFFLDSVMNAEGYIREPGFDYLGGSATLVAVALGYCVGFTLSSGVSGTFCRSTTSSAS